MRSRSFLSGFLMGLVGALASAVAWYIYAGGRLPGEPGPAVVIAPRN